MSAKSFVRAMKEKGFVQQMVRANRYSWKGIGIAAPDDVQEAFSNTFWQRDNN
jgi:hypothetical protein